MPRKKLLIIYNPHAGRGEFPAKLSDVADRFTKAGFDVSLRPTQGKNDARDTVLSSANSFDCVCCCGGDGMASEMIEAAMKLEKRPALGFIPTGTVNDFASSLGLPKDPVAAAGIVASGIPREIDAGCFGGRYFAYVAAFGLFTDVSYHTPQDAKNLFGQTAYMLEAAMRLGSIISYNCMVLLDGEMISGDFVFGMALNALSVGGFKMPADMKIQLDDGLFEVLLVKTPKNLSDLQEIVSSLLAPYKADSAALVFRQVKSMRITSQTSIDWTVDGEFGGSLTDIFIENKKCALEIMAPRPEISLI